jgi:hypothetical protein
MQGFFTTLHVGGYQALSGTLYKQSIFVFLAQHTLVFQTYFQVSVGLVSQMGDSDRHKLWHDNFLCIFSIYSL